MNKSKVFVFSVFALMLVASVLAHENIAFSESNEAKDIAEITEDISASDIVKSEGEVDAENSRYAKTTISSGSGWVTTDSMGALAAMHLVNGYASATDSEADTSKGWLMFGRLKLRLDSTDISEGERKFNVYAGDRLTGTLTLDRSSTYQNGFAIWTGDLSIEVEGVGYNADVNLAIEERALADKIKDQINIERIGVIGTLNLGNEYSLNGKVSSNLDRLELNVAGVSTLERLAGTLVLERTTGTEFVGKLRIKEVGGDDVMLGRIKGNLRLDGTSLTGDVTFTPEDGFSSEGTGTISLTLDRAAVVAEVSNAVKGAVDRSGSNSGSDSASSERKGFWRRFIDFFG